MIKGLWRKKTTGEKVKFLSIILIIIGCLIRLWNIGGEPYWVQQDEVSIGYEAYSILNYGIDRSGNSYPVHLNSWGSGQNALYAYLLMPFIALFGNTTFALRLPMALVGCVSIIVLYRFLKHFKLRNRYKLIILGLFVIFPWHIVKSRWCIESNLLPDMIFWALAALYVAIKDKNNKYGILSAIILGLSAYAYGVTYLYLPVLFLCLALFLLLNKKQKIHWKNILILLATITVVSLPMIIFVIINYFELSTIQICGITIPRLDHNRFTEMTNFSNINKWFINLGQTGQILWNQSDGMALNSVSSFGLFYLFSTIFIIYGIVVSFTKKYRKNAFIHLLYSATIAAFAVIAVTEPTVYRINVIWFPLFAFWAIGVIEAVGKNQLFTYTLCGVYATVFIMFTVTYFTTYQDRIRDAYTIGLEQAIVAADKYKSEGRDMYIINEKAYIYYLYYQKVDTNYYIENRVIPEKDVMFQRVEKIGNVSFTLPQEINKRAIYIIPTNQINRFSISDFSISSHGEYLLLLPKQ